MIRNYLRVAWRNMLKSKFYSGINITGLAAGLAICMLILIYVMDELSYDRYNKDAERIYRVNNEIKFGDNYFDLAVSPALMGITMVREFPQVEQYTRLRWRGTLLLKKGNENIQEGRVAYADSTLFDVFTLPVLSGDPSTALKEPHSLVLTEKVARKYFNSTEVTGQTMIVNDTGNYKITAVIKDIPSQSHFNFDIFIPMVEDDRSNDDNWLSENWNTYVRLDKNADVKKLEAALNPFIEKHAGPLLQSVTNQSMDEFRKTGGYLRASLTPLTDIHLRSNKMAEIDGNGNIQFIYIFSAVAILVLLIACVNFMNLSTARSSNRAREVGVRKVLGSLRKNLITQFLTESLLISFISLILAILLAWLLLPYFNSISGKSIVSSQLFRPQMVFSLVGIILIVGLLAGSYPAFFLSAFQPIDVLKGKLAGGFKRSWLRNAMVVFQFAVSIMLIFGTIVIYSQLNYIRTRDIGFNRDQVMVINNTSVLGEKANSFKNELMKISGVTNATLSGYLPVNYSRSNDAFFLSPALNQETAMSMQNWVVDEHYLPALGIKLIEGRNFSPDFPTDSTGIIINEAAAKFLATKELLNKKLYNVADINTKQLNEWHVIGVIKNFNFSSLREVVTPLALKFGKDIGNISVRVSGGNLATTISLIKSKWQGMAPGQPFNYSFMDDDFNKLYESEQRTGKIFVSFAVLAIMIAGLGLFGLITFAAEQRVREIGIRKVLGASVGNITGMLSTDFLKLVCISSVIAFPIAWWAMNKWLVDFAYRVSIGWKVFAFAGLIALMIALLSVSFQALRAALANPVKSLRTE